MARQWNLPAEFAALIEEHVAIDRLADADSADPLKSAVRLSSLLPAAGDDAWHEGAQFERAYQRLVPEGGPGLVEFLGRLDDEFKQFAPVLNVSTSAKSLVDSFNEFAAAGAAAS